MAIVQTQPVAFVVTANGRLIDNLRRSQCSRWGSEFESIEKSIFKVSLARNTHLDIYPIHLDTIS